MFKSAAILGFGVLGKPIVEALISAGITPIILSRSSSSKPGLPEGVEIVPVTYSDKASVTAALKAHNVDVVISILSEEGLGIQPVIAEAAKDAGVKLFFPSEFGFPTMYHHDGFIGHKNTISGKIAEILPTVRIITGFFNEWVPLLTTTSKHPGKISLLRPSSETGSKRVTLTSLSDIGGFIAYILTHLSLDQLSGAIYRLQGKTLTLSEVATLYGKEIVEVDKEDFDVGFIAVLQGFVAKGWTSTGHDMSRGESETQEDVLLLAGEGNKTWEGHRFKGLKEVLPSF